MLKTDSQNFFAVAMVAVVIGLMGCVSGGGSGDATTKTVEASVSVKLTDLATGATLTSISSGNPVKVSATVRDTTGAAVANTVVTFATTASLATIIPSSGTALTDETGVAFVQIVAASPAAAGATTISATASVGSASLAGSVGFSVVSINVGTPSLTVALSDPVTGTASTNISSGKPALVKVTVKDASGAIVPNSIVTFITDSSLATMTPSKGTALTNAGGIASIQIDPTSQIVAGATTITATATVNGSAVSGSTNFSVTASSVGVPGVSVVLADPTTGSAVTSISPGSPAKVLATIRDAAGSGVANTVVTFSTTALAAMTPSTGTALTNASGVASVQIDAASLTAAGATTITATATVAGAVVSGSTGFGVSAANAVLGSFTLGTNPLSSYATTSVSIPVTGVPVTTPVTIKFSSICSGSGKATLPDSVQTVNGVATATYTDKGCASTDTITASVAGLAVTKTTTLTVQSPGATSIQFVSAAPTTIVLKGTGGAGLVESSLIKFKVVDSNNGAIVGADVLFDLTTRAGGILLDGSSTSVSKKTDGNGEVSVSVQSGTTPTAVWVNATVTSVASPFSSQSNQLRISTGRPAQDRFSLSVGSHNIEGYNINGITTSVSVIASDRLGNPVPDGTAINFIAEGAQIEPSCATASGACGVTFTSANPRPTSDSEPSGIVTSGRVTVAAYTLGEESFVDANGNNTYASGETFTDLGDVFIDSNENGVWNAGEQAISYAGNGQACTNTIGASPSAPSKAGACDGVWGQAHVRQDSVIVLSGSSGYVNKTRPTSAFVPGTTAPTTTYSMGGATVCTNAFPFYAFDQNRNPLPLGTNLATASPPTSLGTVTISPSSVQNTASAGGTAHSILISKPSVTDATTGVVSCVTVGTGGVPLTVTMTTPKGTVSAASFLITD